MSDVKVSWHLRLLLAALSGQLAALATGLPWPLEDRSLLQGAVFAALVLVPFLASGRWRAGRALLLVSGGMVIQLIAVRVALRLYLHPPLSAHPRLWVATALAGTAGALLVAALARLVIPVLGGLQLWAPVALAGLLGGLALGLPSALGVGPAWTFGLVTWQVLVCAALHVGGTHVATRAELVCTLRGQRSP
jgi:hypothetical protein